MNGRNRPPGRRARLAGEAGWTAPDGVGWLIGYSYGFAAAPGDARVDEVFVDYVQVGAVPDPAHAAPGARGRVRSDSVLLAQLSDAAVLASVALQYGEDPGALAARLGREGTACDAAVDAALPCASPIGAVLREVARRWPEERRAIVGWQGAIDAAREQGTGNRDQQGGAG